MYDRTCRDRQDAPPGAAFTLRFKAPVSGHTVVDDLVKGKVIFDNVELDDLVIVRSDGTPTYNFCAVIDDATMRISHIIRGDDHLTNTPKQIQIYQALGFDVPAFAHLPQILGPDRKRLSKRHGATSVMAYKEMGYLPDALVNYLVRLGWSHGDQEIFSRAELVEKFTLENVGAAAGVYNAEKAEWLNAHYIKSLSPAELASAVLPYIQAKGYHVTENLDWLARMAVTLQERSKTLVELVEQAHFYLSDIINFDPSATRKHLKPEIAPALASLREALAQLPEWNHDAIHAGFEGVMRRFELQLGKIAQPVRVALTGGTVSPGIFEIVDVLGRERTLARLDNAVAQCTAAAPLT
jgi:glutamyl-tRNA synthetase